MNLAIRLWRGDIPLGTTYWLFGVLPNAVVFIASSYLARDAQFIATPAGILITLGLGLVGVAYFVFIGVAIWRSASKYQGERWLAILAKVVVILAALRFVSELTKLSGGPSPTGLQ